VGGAGNQSGLDPIRVSEGRKYSITIKSTSRNTKEQEMSFGAIRDQEVATRLLKNILVHHRVPNGLLFWGPGGIGKRMAAIEFTKALNCAQGNGDACDTCLPCRKIANRNHPDVMFIAPVKKSRIIDVETVESMNSLASLRPFESKWRVSSSRKRTGWTTGTARTISSDARRTTGNSLFILITEHPGRLLPTIRSRCQRVRFGPLRQETVRNLLLRDRDLPEDVADSIAALSQGQMSRAVDLIDTNKREIVLDVTRRLESGEDPVAMAEEFCKHLDNPARPDQNGHQRRIRRGRNRATLA